MHILNKQTNVLENYIIFEITHAHTIIICHKCMYVHGSKSCNTKLHVFLFPSKLSIPLR